MLSSSTHTDRAHIHNHIIFNSTSLDGTRKFRNFYLSTFALQRISDLICLERGLSVITPKPYRERQKHTDYPKKESIRNLICRDIDRILQGPSAPKDFEEFLKKLREAGYEIKTGKNISIRGKNQKRFVRLSSLSEGYREAYLRQYFLNPTVRKTQSRPAQRKKRISLLIDVQEKLQTKGPGYARWAKVHNLKEMSKSLLFLREHGIDSREDLNAFVDTKIAERDALRDTVQTMKKRITEIAALRKHIYNYSDTRATYEAYRKAGYSKKFFEAHREERAATTQLCQEGLGKLPNKHMRAESRNGRAG